MTLAAKCPPNRDLELQRTELVQDTNAWMVQDIKIMLSMSRDLFYSMRVDSLDVRSLIESDHMPVTLTIKIYKC